LLIGSDLSSMVAAIELDHEPVLRTAEIHNVRTDGVLPTKLGVMELPVTQLPPEYPLTVGLPPAKPSGKPTAPAPLTLPLSPSRGEGSLMSLPHRCAHTNSGKPKFYVAKLKNHKGTRVKVRDSSESF
jgi:hypothetical protein